MACSLTSETRQLDTTRLSFRLPVCRACGNSRGAMTPLPYHLELRDFLRASEPELWEWFAGAARQTGSDGELDLELLKTTYRLEGESHAAAYAEAAAAAAALGLAAPVTLYQATDAGAPGANAVIYYSTEAIHIVFFGSLLRLLAPLELRALFGHELAHFRLWEGERGELRVADRLLHAAAQEGSVLAQHESLRRWRLQTEIYCDRGALLAAGDLPAAVAMLCKVITGLAEASGESLLRQAAEIFARSSPKSKETSHPEMFIRVHALALWDKRGTEAEAEIADLIEGDAALDQLDLLGQRRLCGQTRLLLNEALQSDWSRSEAALAHARSFFPGFEPADELLADQAFKSCPPSLREYVAAVLFDFVRIDPEIEDPALEAALRSSARLGVMREFDRLAAKELGLKVRDLRERRQKGAAASEAEPEEGGEA